MRFVTTIRPARASLERFADKTGIHIKVDCYASAEAYIDRNEKTPDVLLPDIYPDGIDGITLARKLRGKGFGGPSY